jgi:hypothetical protein
MVTDTFFIYPVRNNAPLLPLGQRLLKPEAFGAEECHPACDGIRFDNNSDWV